MTALRTSPIVARTRRPAPSPRFEIGDRVHLVPDGTEGLVVGVRYGAPAYDVKISGTCLRNLSPDRLRLADTATPASIVPLRRIVMEMPDLLC